MTVNEKIAKWLEYKWIPARGYSDGEWKTKDGDYVPSIAFDKDITLWHGEDGLLAEIHAYGAVVYSAFLQALSKRIVGDRPMNAVGTLWLLCKRTKWAEDFAAALVEMIEEEE